MFTPKPKAVVARVIFSNVARPDYALRRLTQKHPELQANLDNIVRFCLK